MHIFVYFWYQGTNIGHSLHAYTDQTWLKWNLGIMEICLKQETLTVPRIQTSVTCSKWNLSAVEKNCGPLRFLYRHVSVYQVLVPQHKYWTKFAILHLVLMPRHKYLTQFTFLHLVLVPGHKYRVQFAILHLVLVPQHKYFLPPPLLPLEAVPCLLLLHEEMPLFLLSIQPKPLLLLQKQNSDVYIQAEIR